LSLTCSPRSTSSSARRLYADGKHTVAEIAALFGIGRQTIYRALEPDVMSSSAAG
jgi:DNA invertase Pin-like site-specific DNA recombinase